MNYHAQLLLWLGIYVVLGLALRRWIVRRPRNGGKR